MNTPDLPSALRRNTSLTFATRLLLIELCEGPKTYGELCAHIGFCGRNCRRMVVELEARGWVHRRVEDGLARVELAAELPIGKPRGAMGEVPG